MKMRQIVLVALAVVLVVPAFLLTTKDQFVDGNNCGAALFPRDTSQLIEASGDLGDDEFNREAITAQCSQAHTRQWFFAGLCVLAGVGLVVIALRYKPAEPRFPGDPVI